MTNQRRSFSLGYAAALAITAAPAIGDFWLLDEKIYEQHPDSLNQCGKSVRLAGDLALVGVPESTYLGARGLAQLFEYDEAASRWRHAFPILDGSLGVDAEMGWDLDLQIDGDDVETVIGAPNADGDRGAVVIDAYTRSPIWVQTDRDVLSDGGSPDDWYGFAVALDGDHLVVGAHGRDGADTNSGVVIFYERTAGSWSESRRFDGNEAAVSLGYAVDIDGDYAVVGGPGADRFGINGSGTARVYKRTGGAWALVDTLWDPTPLEAEHFGGTVAIDGDIIIAGSDSDDGGSYGFMHVYRREAGTDNFAREATLQPSDLALGDGFGQSASVDGSRILVGAPHRIVNGTDSAGAAYLFEYDGSAWSQIRMFAATSRDENDMFGIDVDIDECTLIIGALSDDDLGHEAGAAYVYKKYSTGAYQAESLPAMLRSKVLDIGPPALPLAAGSAEFAPGEWAAAVWEPAEEGGWTQSFLPDFGAGSEAVALAQIGTQVGTPKIAAAGSALVPNGELQPVIWISSEQGWELSALPTDGMAGGSLVSSWYEEDSGWIVTAGEQRDEAGLAYATIWSRLSDPPVWEREVLPSFPGSGDSAVYDFWIADTAFEPIAVGRAENSHGIGRPVRWVDNGQGLQLFGFPVPQGATDGAARAIDEHAEAGLAVAGDFRTPDGRSHPCLWITSDQAWQRVDLAEPADFEEVKVTGLAAEGDTWHAVGTASNGPGTERGVIWTVEADGSSSVEDLTLLITNLEDGIVVDSVTRVFPSRNVVGTTRPENEPGQHQAVILSPQLVLPACDGDIDGDGAVAFGDILRVLSAWGPCSGCDEDLDESGEVDFGDILFILARWGPCP